MEAVDFDDELVSAEDCPSGACNDTEECGACEGSGDDGGGDFDGRGCDSCGGSGVRVPEHCCACGGSPYCNCCSKCGARCVGECRCPITTQRDGKQVTV